MGLLFLYHALFGLGVGVLGAFGVWIAQSRPEVKLFNRPVMTITLLEIPASIIVVVLLALLIFPLYEGRSVTALQKVLLLLTMAVCCLAVIFLADLFLPERKKDAPKAPREGPEDR